MSNLQESFREAARREFAMVPTESELEYSFSARFQKKMRRIIRAQVHGYWQFVNTTAKRVVCIAAIVVMLLTTAMAIKPVRERVIEFFIDIYENFFEITFGETESGDLYPTLEPMTSYIVTWLPDGYYQTECVENDTFRFISWRKDGTAGISLFQEPGTNNITMNRSDNELTKITLGDKEVTYQMNDSTHTFIWEQDGYIFLMTVYDDVSMNDMLSIITSITETQ